MGHLMNIDGPSGRKVPVQGASIRSSPQIGPPKFLEPTFNDYVLRAHNTSPVDQFILLT